ncbi:MAG: IS630 family transposase [Thermoanaerobaculia bacterium]
MRVAPKIELDAEATAALERLARGRRTEVRVVLRARIILLAAKGLENAVIAARVKTSRATVGLWRERYARGGIPAILKDATRPGRPRQNRARIELEVIRLTTQTVPENATHWTTRTLAARLGVDHVFVHRVWRAHGLQPHRVRTFKLSNDPKFVEKLTDVVGLYLNPPDHAIVLCADEKSQIQALDRTQPGLPIKRGRCGTMTHDYKRNGTTTLFAALDTLEGRVIAECMPRHRHQEWIRFLKKIDAEVPAELDVHLIADNYATHKHPKVRRWLDRNPRFHMHFTPTSSSWLNLVERFFRDLTDKRIRRGAFHSVDQLVAAILSYIDAHNEAPWPFVWCARSEEIIEKVGRARFAMQKSITE